MTCFPQVKNISCGSPSYALEFLQFSVTKNFTTQSAKTTIFSPIQISKFLGESHSEVEQ